MIVFSCSVRESQRDSNHSAPGWRSEPDGHPCRIGHQRLPWENIFTNQSTLKGLHQIRFNREPREIPENENRNSIRVFRGLGCTGVVFIFSSPPRVLSAERIFPHARRAGFTIEEIFHLTKIDRWFLVEIKELWILR